MATVAVIGAGLMGTACARRLMQAGFEVLAYDVDEALTRVVVDLSGRPGLVFEVPFTRSTIGESG